ncbi:hypothetical protein H5410_048863 [Solanum commersonii]|uniref:Uncharacterized protein n=1 Tax=Solanum commersonii TaxID=4109 RepID=A0A9J5XKS9_SOLCO|nr:hypothetical protein H5410_048863 [Solanum commersonii]
MKHMCKSCAQKLTKPKIAAMIEKIAGREGSLKCVISVRRVTKTDLCVIPTVKIKHFAFLTSNDGKNLDADLGFKL